MKIKEIGLVALIIFGATLIIISNNYAQKSNNAIKSGLEECPISVGAHDTIWVKDCNSYLNNISKLENK